MLNNYYQKHKGKVQKSLLESNKIFLKKEKTKSANMLESDIKIF